MVLDLARSLAWTTWVDSPAASPSSCTAAYLWPSLHHCPLLLCAHPWRAMQSQEDVRIAQPLQLLVDLDLALSAITGLYHCAPAASHSSCMSHATSLTPDTRLHCCALETRVSSWDSHTDSQNPHSCWCTCSCSPCCLPWLPPLCVCLQLAPATAECVFTTGSSHYCCLPWSLASELGLTSENPNCPCSHCRYSSWSITKDHAVERVLTCPTPVQHITRIPSQSNLLDKEEK